MDLLSKTINIQAQDLSNYLYLFGNSQILFKNVKINIYMLDKANGVVHRERLKFSLKAH